jgi:hypothetical protein
MMKKYGDFMDDHKMKTSRSATEAPSSHMIEVSVTLPVGVLIQQLELKFT